MDSRIQLGEDWACYESSEGVELTLVFKKMNKMISEKSSKAATHLAEILRGEYIVDNGSITSLSIFWYLTCY